MDKTSFLGIQTVENILKTYGNDILRLSYSYMKNISDSEDVLQDTLIKYMNTMPEFESTSHQKAWLFRVAINICKNKLKSSWFKTEQLSEDYTMLTNFNDNENMIIGAINSLTVKYREVLFLFYYEGYSKENKITVDGIEVTIKGDDRLYKVITWNNDNFSYSITSTAGLSEDIIHEIIRNIK